MTKPKTKPPLGWIIYEGPSLIDGGPIVAILTIPGEPTKANRKTGAMAQIWIMRSDMDPVTANRIGADTSICGACPLKGIARPDADRGQAEGRGCYVVLIQRPLALYRALIEGRLDRIDPERAAEMVEGWAVRVGAYGDGAAVPGDLFERILARARTHTDYTHQLDSAGDARPARSMISVETLEAARSAWARGFRTFRTMLEAEQIDPAREILCPATLEGGQRTTCEECGLCAGLRSRSPKSIAAVIHGNSAAKAGAARALRAMGVAHAGII